MSHRLKTYLRTHRRRHGLTQDEVALLAGMQSGTHISHIERLDREPSVTTLIACSFIFSAPPDELFPGLHEDIHRAVRKRAEKLYEELQGSSQRATPAKLNLLENIINRAAAADNSISI